MAYGEYEEYYRELQAAMEGSPQLVIVEQEMYIDDLDTMAAPEHYLEDGEISEEEAGFISGFESYEEQIA